LGHFPQSLKFGGEGFWGHVTARHLLGESAGVREKRGQTRLHAEYGAPLVSVPVFRLE